MSAIRLTITAAKGGVSKSTTAVNLAGFLSQRLKGRVLVVDTDSQSSNSQQFLTGEQLDRLSTPQTAAALFDDSCPADPSQMIHATRFKGIDFVPASHQLERYDLPEPHRMGDKQFALREFLNSVAKDYAFVICDTPPKPSTLAPWNCLLASHFALTPLVMEEDSIQSITGTDRIIRAAAERNPNLSFLGYVVTLFSKRCSLHAANEKLLRQVHGDRVLETVVSHRVAFAEARTMKTPISMYKDAGEAAKINKRLCMEILTRAEQQLTARRARKENERRAA